MGTIKVPAAAMGKVLEREINTALKIYGEEIAREWASRGMRHAVRISAYATGKYRASHRVSTGTARGAGLGDQPAYGIPGDFEVDAGMRGFILGTMVYLVNDAADDATDYVYAHNVEEEGWGSTPAYRVYQRTAQRLSAQSRDIMRVAVRETIRR